MGSRLLYPLAGLLMREVIVLAGRFFPNGGSAVDNTANVGRGFTVAHTGTGEFTITLTDKWAQLLFAGADLCLATPADSQAQITSVNLATRTVVVTVLTAGSPADIAAAAGNYVSFLLIVRNTTT